MARPTDVKKEKRKKAKIYQIKADYRPKNPNKPSYYVLAYNKKQAKEIFKASISWLDIYEVNEISEDQYDDLIEAGKHGGIILI